MLYFQSIASSECPDRTETERRIAEFEAEVMEEELRLMNARFDRWEAAMAKRQPPWCFEVPPPSFIGIGGAARRMAEATVKARRKHAP